MSTLAWTALPVPGAYHACPAAEQLLVQVPHAPGNGVLHTFGVAAIFTASPFDTRRHPLPRLAQWLMAADQVVPREVYWQSRLPVLRLNTALVPSSQVSAAHVVRPQAWQAPPPMSVPAAQVPSKRPASARGPPSVVAVSTTQSALPFGLATLPWTAEP